MPVVKRYFINEKWVLLIKIYIRNNINCYNMSTQEKQHDGLDEVNEALSRTEQIVEKYQKQIMFSVLAVIIVITAIIALRQYYFLPKEHRAQAELFRGEFYCQENDFSVMMYLGTDETNYFIIHNISGGITVSTCSYGSYTISSVTMFIDMV